LTSSDCHFQVANWREVSIDEAYFVVDDGRVGVFDLAVQNCRGDKSGGQRRDCGAHDVADFVSCAVVDCQSVVKRTGVGG